MKMAAVSSISTNELTNKAPNHEEIQNELRRFVSGAAANKVSSEAVAKSGLLLLRYLPVARYAVLEHIGNMFCDSVNTHILLLDLERDMEEAEDTSDPNIVAVQDVLMSLVKNNPEAWAPIISAWCIELLGDVSGKYAGHRGVPHFSSLSQLLQMWMSCQPTRVLIDVASQCFAAMVGDAPDICVDALLEASVKHSPHFDWVVAHIGSCFPTTIITRVLMTGLKDYSQHGSDSAPEQHRNQPKMQSVVGILGHLAARHNSDIRKALHKLFKSGLECKSGSMEQCAVPFLLHLASMSPMLLQIIATDLTTAVKISTLNQLADQMTDSRSKHADVSTLLPLIVHLLTKCPQGIYRLLQFIMDIADPKPPSEDAMDTSENVSPAVQKTACNVLDHFCWELDRLSHLWGVPNGPPPTTPCLVNLKNHTKDLCSDLITATGKRSEWLSIVVGSMAVYNGVTTATDVITDLLTTDTGQKQLQVIIKIIACVESKHSDALLCSVGQALRTITCLSGKKRQNLMDNLRHLLLWQRKQFGEHTISMYDIESCIWPQLSTVSSQLTSCGALEGSALNLLIALDVPPDKYLPDISGLITAVIALFFRALHLKDAGKKVSLCNRCVKYLQKLVHFPKALKPILRLCLEGALSKDNSSSLGSKTMPPPRSVVRETDESVSLVSDNQKQAMSVVVPRMHATVFHAGVIGTGLKAVPKPSSFSLDEQMQNRHLLLELIWSCSHISETSQSESAILSGRSSPRPPADSRCIPANIGRHLALLLIELAAPDVMYNGLPWPEEEFMKVTVERDLLIRTAFDNIPILWDFMDLLTYSPGQLCYCSSLLRGVAATLLTYWESCREKRAVNAPKPLATSCRLVTVMRRGGFIPPPLANIDQLLAYLAPYEVYLLLQAVWRFMKEKPPIPDPRENASRLLEPRHSRVLRNILHSNISTLGHLYSSFFPTTQN